MDVLESGAVTETAESPRDAQDLRPEFFQYQDEGCEYAPACLECPFPRCLYDEPRGRQRWMKTLRDREIARRFKTGAEISELAEAFEVSPRTVHRAINKGIRD